MSDAVASSSSLPGAVNPPAISLRDIWPWAVFALALLTLLYTVGVEQGAASFTSGDMLHEWVHDGRHLLGFPCH
jgi:cobalt transporter subunit CbtB